MRPGPPHNDFQALVYLLKKELAEGALVTESALVPDADGQNREIDILIEGEIGGHPMTLAIECRDHARKQAVGWVEEMSAKYHDMPIDRLILVARSGFSEPAKTKARRLNIEALSLEEASEEDAARRLLFNKPIALVRRKPKIQVVVLGVEISDGTVVDVDGDADTIVFLDNGDELGTLGETVVGLINEPRFEEFCRSHRDLRNPDDALTPVWRNPKTTLGEGPAVAICVQLVPSGELRRIDQIRAVIGFESTRSEVTMRHSRLGDTNVSWGSAMVGETDALLVVPDHPDRVSDGVWLRTENGDVRLKAISGTDPAGYSEWQKDGPSASDVKA